MNKAQRKLLLRGKNKTYFHPGVRTASGAPQPGSFNGLAPFFPQRGRQVSVRMLINIAPIMIIQNIIVCQLITMRKQALK